MKKTYWNHRDLLKTFGAATVEIGIVQPVIGNTSANQELFTNPKIKNPDRPVECVDNGLVHDFVQAVYQQDPSLLTSTIDVSMESHLIGFKAEESRLNG